ncbi:MAG: LPS export ABC transporter ATP-binding protein [Candidatus Hydrothermota bacterium]|nr:MAG: LPS export ABC transporter ATP-binding protein [Candidatus Hydrothermae bacterium]
MEVLRTEKLIKIYGGKRAVDEVSLEITPGEIVGLLGPNGAGKTTTFYMIMGAVKPDGGDVYLGDRRLTGLPMYRRARMGISYLPQEPSIFRKLSVFDNVYSVAEMRGMEREKAEEEARKVLELMGIWHLRERKAALLSGGERRRVEIARSLILKPKFLLLDEPFTGIDPKTRSEIQDIVKGLKKMGIGVLITDHNVRETLEITDRAYIIYEGKVLLSGTAEMLVSDPKARELYLGERFRL